MASIIKRGNILWIKLYQNGEMVRKSTGLTDTPQNRKAVEKELLPKLVLMAKSGELEKAPKRVKTVREYIKIFLDIKSKEIRRSTMKHYTQKINKHILPKFGKVPVDELKASELRNWLATLSVGDKAKKEIRAVFGAILREALYDEAIPKNPIDFVRVPRPKKPIISPFNKEEVGLLLKHSYGWFKNFIALGVYSGMRTGEMLAIKWENLDFDNYEIHVEASRTNGIEDGLKTEMSHRVIPMFKPLLPYLKNQFCETGLKNGYVFLNKDGNPLFGSSTVIRRYWLPLLEKCGLGYRRLYETRHTFATNMLESGEFSVGEIAEMMGHTSTQMLFTRYTAFIKSEQKNRKIDVDIFSQLGTKTGTVSKFA